MTNELDSNGINKIEVKVEGDTIILQSTELGAFEFKNLLDVPNSYEGQSGKLLQVKSTEDGLEFTDSPTVVDWDEIGGDQSSVNLSGFTNDR